MYRLTKTEWELIVDKVLNLEKENKKLKGVIKGINKALNLPVVSVALKQGIAGACEEASKHIRKPKCVRDGIVKRNER